MQPACHVNSPVARRPRNTHNCTQLRLREAGSKAVDLGAVRWVP